MTPQVPTAEQQLRFLKNLQRILDEGLFTSSYKFALLHALADLAVEKGDDSGAALPLRTVDISERFVSLYWRQVVPWPHGGEETLLAQNTGRQAAIVRRVREARREYGDGLPRVRTDDDAWSGLVGEVARVVKVMPLWRLQVVGNEPHEFLYRKDAARGRGTTHTIILNPGVAYCLRSLYPLVVELVQGAWARFVRRQNPEVLGERAELRSFLFGCSRGVLSALRPVLEEFQGRRCFYCRREIRGRSRDRSHVDHFIPWSRYPTDLGHNFVLAHQSCNLKKSDHLAARDHLARWAERNRKYRYDLAAALDQASVPHDLPASLQVTRWAYRQVEERRGRVWVQGRTLVELEAGWHEALEPAPC